MIKVLFICHGNICRSPMAEFIFKDYVEKKGTKELFVISSCATSTEEIWGDRGNPIYPPAKEELRKLGIGNTPYTDYRKKRAVQITPADYEYYDYLLCADTNNIRNTIRITGPDDKQKIKLLLDYTNRPGRSIRDPWYSGNFQETTRDILEGIEAFYAFVMQK